MGNSRNFDHAIHNEEVYRFLSSKPEFCDWIITTAFYSAIHYVRYIMVPCKIIKADTKSHDFEDFESLYADQRQDREGRHGYQRRWVRDKHSEISPCYRRLHELSEEARYINYQFINGNITPEVNQHLKKIRLYCKKIKPLESPKQP